ncbi:MAG: Asp-tRNA(Asn)/Glu-tRNA(Gln) amidotransferase GatCAB subunit A [Candidatus Omnitrophica bacterium CG07_land_8_20_14_0_80_50_8]|nr:MAG: aspartyl/glutamyl-tRNA amidotransferase subunit A [Candidatus Omnitrophica bacterium CG1_02_49_16]PIU40716.1 MAG: Asp-tRNA(Asn)/Glu-tRNA(Gln) amidotransferase GatCAB subunit A [Candidatus Omnitrophica bacterium CG07_land_8_20_14_0_80_50_8]
MKHQNSFVHDTGSLSKLTIHQLADRYANGALTCDGLLHDLSAAIRSRDRDQRQIRAYINFDSIRPIRREVPKASKLWGIPIAVKDNLCVAGEETTCGSKILKGFISPYHATVVEKLLNAGAVIFGRTNQDEFAFGSSCETSCYGPTRNPRDPERVPGGSSGGSAACVADHTAIAALGSDTGGSIRQPASFCGVVGMKPTYGRVSRYGLIAFASSLDQIGPITKDVRDNALFLNVIAGHDPKDSTSADVPVPDYSDFLGRSIQGMRIGIAAPVQTPILENAVKVLKSLGAKVEALSLPHIAYAVSVYYIVAPAEASSNLARFDGVRFGFRDKSAPSLLEMYEHTRGQGFGAEAKRRIILGTYSLSSGYYDAYYLHAMKVRTKIKNDFDAAFKKVDAILSPTAPSPAFKLGEKAASPLEMYLSDIYTIPANLAGVPALSVPGGTDHSTGGKDLPLGLQFIGKPFDEGTLYQLAYAFEQATDYHKRLGNVC